MSTQTPRAAPHLSLVLVSGFHDASEGSAATARGPVTKLMTFGPSGADPGPSRNLLAALSLPWSVRK